MADILDKVWRFLSSIAKAGHPTHGALEALLALSALSYFFGVVHQDIRWTTSALRFPLFTAVYYYSKTEYLSRTVFDGITRRQLVLLVAFVLHTILGLFRLSERCRLSERYGIPLSGSLKWLQLRTQCLPFPRARCGVPVADDPAVERRPAKAHVRTRVDSTWKGVANWLWMWALFTPVILHGSTTLASWLASLPLYFSLTIHPKGQSSWGGLDYVAAVLIFAGVALHALAGIQLDSWLEMDALDRIEVARLADIAGKAAAKPKASAPAQRSRSAQLSICREGLWAYCRHPDVLGDMLLWLGAGLHGAAAVPASSFTLVGTGLGLATLWTGALLRQAAILSPIAGMERDRGDTRLQDAADYVEYMREVPALIPAPWRSGQPHQE